MTDDLPDDLTSEVVAEYADKANLERAVTALRAAGFERSDLSVLATHDSLDVMAEDQAGVRGDLPLVIAGETEFLGLIATAGVILLASGPWGALAAGIAGLAGGALALEPLLDRITQSAHARGFAKALESGRILLWVRTADADRVAGAEAALLNSGGVALRRLALPVREAIADVS
jgi:hypothetical protein